jgi:hypothetical protein
LAREATRRYLLYGLDQQSSGIITAALAVAAAAIAGFGQIA